MASKAELEQEIAALNARLAEFDPTVENHGLKPGDIRLIHLGQATVTGFYTEDGIDKIRVSALPCSSKDGKTPQPDAEPFNCSMPVDLFLKRVAQFSRDLKSGRWQEEN